MLALPIMTLDRWEFGGGNDEEHNGASFMEISDIFAIQDPLFFGTISFEKVYYSLMMAWWEKRT